MDDSSIRMWIKYLAINEIYCEYCLARANGDSENLERMEGSQSLLRQLYEDFGDLTEILSMPYLSTCDFSIEKYEYLFRFDKSVRVFDESSVPPDRYGYAKFEIKIHADFESIKAEVEEALYQQFARMYPDAARAAMFTLDFKIDRNGPRYYLCTPELSLDKVALGMLEKVWYLVWLRREILKKQVKTPSVVDLILEVKRRRDNPLGWYLTTSEKVELGIGGFKEMHRHSSESTLVKRYQKMYLTLAKNILVGKFPDWGKVRDLRKLLAGKECEPPPGFPAIIPEAPPGFDIGELFNKS